MSEKVRALITERWTEEYSKVKTKSPFKKVSFNPNLYNMHSPLIAYNEKQKQVEKLAKVDVIRSRN